MKFAVHISSLQSLCSLSPAKLGHLEQQHINQLSPINPTTSAVDASI